jgi:hypothetical protein
VRGKERGFMCGRGLGGGWKPKKRKGGEQNDEAKKQEDDWEDEGNGKR